MFDNRIVSIEECNKRLLELFGEDDMLKEDEIKEIERLKGECGELVWIDSDLGFESMIFVVNDEGEMFGFEGNNGESRGYRLDSSSIVSLLMYELNKD